MSELYWFSDLTTMPIQGPVLNISEGQIPQPAPKGFIWIMVDVAQIVNIAPTEKQAIAHARQLRVAEIDYLQAEINQLDARYDEIETAEVAAEARGEE